jgi:predicted nucleotidyltransferase
MVDQQQIEWVAERLGTAAHAERIILFGSYARGTATENSDVDFLIIAESDVPRFKRSRALYLMFRPYPFPMDLLVYTPQEIEISSRTPVSFISEVLREGRIVYVRGDGSRAAVAGQGQERPAERGQ